jgi:hypothetical protein
VANDGHHIHILLLLISTLAENPIIMSCRCYELLQSNKKSGDEEPERERVRRVAHHPASCQNNARTSIRQRWTELEARGPNGHGWRGPRPVPPMLIWPLGLSSLTSCALCASRGKILTPKKSQVNLSLGKFLKCKNTQNRVFLFCRVITKIRGSMENPHKSL